MINIITMGNIIQQKNKTVASTLVLNMHMLAIYCIRILVQIWLAAISKNEVHRYVAVILCLTILYVQHQHVLLCILNVIKLV